MNILSETDLDKLEAAAGILYAAEDLLPVLKSVSWDRTHADAFFASGEQVNPLPEYSRVDTSLALEKVAAARALIDGDTPVHDWLRRFADTTETTAFLLASRGKPDFYQHSMTLYGGPRSEIADGQQSALSLANELIAMLSEFDQAAIRLEPPETLSAHDLKARLDAQLPTYFKENAPEVRISEDLSAKAAAGRDYIRLRADAAFSEKDVTQLLQHEALVHIATAQNGLLQKRFPILAESYPGNARTQEGLAVFAEFISGALDPVRFKRLAQRTVAIDMAANGADFVEIYRYFRSNGAPDARFEAYESARRVFRGGVTTGGAPFTKDSVYLGGLVEVHSYLRAAVRAGNPALIRLLFVGKMDLSDLSAMRMLKEAGAIQEARYLPPWATDLGFLVSYLSYSTFLNRIDLGGVAARYKGLLD